jgi:hypothetical protein
MGLEPERHRKERSPVIAEPAPLMQVRSPVEGDEVCERLRAAGIKCAVEPLPDANSFSSIWGGLAPTVLTVLVDEPDMDKARAVIRDYQTTTKQHDT